MFKFRKVTIGGIESKFILLLTVCILLISGVFTAGSVLQSRSLADLSEKTKKQQVESISKYSKGMVEEIIRKEMAHSVELEARITDGSFEDLRARVTLLAEYAEKLLSEPDSLPEAPWTKPEMSMVDQVTTIVMLADDVQAEDPAIAAKIGQIANLTDIMNSLCETTGAENMYISTPEGIHLATSRNARSWYKEDGTLKSFDPRERYWYQEAVEAGELIFTDVGDDRETGQLCIVCAMPIYDKNGDLLAVAGSDFFLTKIQEAVESAGGNGDFHVITNQNGQVIFSPKKSGEFKAPERSVYGDDTDSDALGTIDLRKSDNRELADFITDIMESKTGIRVISLSDGTYYMAGSVIPSVGWTEISVFSRDRVDDTIRKLTEKFNGINDDAATEFNAKRKLRTLITAAIIVAVAILLLYEARNQGRRIVEPLNLITKRISEISGKEIEFTMEDAYRTGDEIEILAEAFAKLSHDSKNYISLVKAATAERERISTELQMANQIQEAMLPSTFPAYPDCTAFDIYASMSPAKEVGGDFYDFFFVDADHLAMVIADVSGKGIPAALFMMISRTIIKNCAMLKKSAAEILEEANRALCSENSMEMFVTVWIGILELSTGLIKTANAGHEHPVIFRCHEGEFKLIKDRHNFVIGGMENMTYREGELILHPGDKLFVYTDGVPEAENAKNEFFGTDRMLEALNRSHGGSPKDMVISVRKAIDEFVGTAEQFDDLTMLCLEYKGGELPDA